MNATKKLPPEILENYFCKNCIDGEPIGKACDNFESTLRGYYCVNVLIAADILCPILCEIDGGVVTIDEWNNCGV